ncbi:hypothetical protein MMC13_008134 [Lambiella insularis]|nr:hypothetical protein [Lambiella insularis]
MASASVYENLQPSQLNVNIGSRAHFFKPPNTPVASHSLRFSSVVTDYESEDRSVRKRPRKDSLHSGQSIPYFADTGTPSAVNTPSIASPLPFVNTRYRLAGGLDTPSAALSSALDSEGTPNPSFGRAGRSHASTFPPEDYFGDVSLALGRERNGRSRIYNSQASNDGWGKAVVSVMSGVAGRLWEFCKAGSFRGFHAGGSRGYTSKSPIPSPFGLSTTQSSTWQDLSPSTNSIFDSASNSSTAVPGGFPDSDFITDYMSNPSPTATPPRASKKQKHDPASSWVLVPSDVRLSRETSPSRLISRKVPSSASTPSARRPVSNGPLRRPVLCASRPTPNLSPATNRPASSASARSPLPSPRRQSHRRTQSHSTDGGIDPSVSPISAEAQRFAARARRREKEEERALQGFNERLKAMIREGKEALGTKIEVEVHDTDGDDY